MGILKYNEWYFALHPWVFKYNGLPYSWVVKYDGLPCLWVVKYNNAMGYDQYIGKYKEIIALQFINSMLLVVFYVSNDDNVWRIKSNWYCIHNPKKHSFMQMYV